LIVLRRPPVPDTFAQRVRTGAKRAAGEAVIRAWETTIELGAIGPDTRRGKRFGQVNPVEVYYKDLVPD